MVGFFGYVTPSRDDSQQRLSTQHSDAMGDHKMRGRQRQGKCLLKSEFASPTRLRCQIHANSPGVEFLKALSKFRKRKKISSSLLVFNTSSMMNMKGVVHETIRNDDFKRAAWKVGAILQPFDTMSQQCCYVVLLLGCFDNSNSRVRN